MSIVKVCWSGGKDSTCSVLLHLRRNDYVKAVCYVPMFTKEIPLITKRHYNFILETAEVFRKSGCDVFFADGMTYCDYVSHRALSGKYKGQIFGFPCINPGQCGFKRDSKLKAVNSVCVGAYDYESIGIAYDEVSRHDQLNESLRSILVEEKFTESMAGSLCFSSGLLSPHYQYSNRDGCILCPNAKERERQIWYSDFPDAKPLLIELQNFVKSERPDSFPLRNYQMFIDTDPQQLSFF